jgi:hypothetical protein
MVQVTRVPNLIIVVNPPNPSPAHDRGSSTCLGVLVKKLTHENRKVARGTGDDAIKGKKVMEVKRHPCFFPAGWVNYWVNIGCSGVVDPLARCFCFFQNRKLLYQFDPKIDA